MTPSEYDDALQKHGFLPSFRYPILSAVADDDLLVKMLRDRIDEYKRVASASGHLPRNLMRQIISYNIHELEALLVMRTIEVSTTMQPTGYNPQSRIDDFAWVLKPDGSCKLQSSRR